MATENRYSDLDFIADFEVRQEKLSDLERRILSAPIDIQNALSNYQALSDSFQQKVIETKEPTVRMVAPAGSGKTQTVINRVIYRVRNGLNPSRILVLTFDNAAASSLRNHLASIKVELAVRISTLNAFGYWVLREYVPQEFKEIIPDYRSRRLFREVKEALKEKSAERYAAVPRTSKTAFSWNFLAS